jgi:glycogen(starch) synthase
LENRVVWLGHREHEECSTYLWASDIAILPFDLGVRLNNSSLTVCAMHGLPIITTEGENLETAFQHQQNVMLCPPKNVPALASVIESLLQSAELRRTLGAGAKAMAQSLLSWEVAIQSTRHVIQSVLPPGAVKTRVASHQFT